VEPAAGSASLGLTSPGDVYLSTGLAVIAQDRRLRRGSAGIGGPVFPDRRGFPGSFETGTRRQCWGGTEVQVIDW
jgi:hypothetical protein